MGIPLISKEEELDYENQLHLIDERYGYHKKDRASFDWKSYWNERECCRIAYDTKLTRLAKERPEDILNALLVCIDNKGEKYVPFYSAFEHNDSEEISKSIQKADTPENRRWLYTILRALTEIPKSWAKSAFVRFLRGIGKQKDSKYHGAGLFGEKYGWTTRQIDSICGIIASCYSGGSVSYASLFMSYADVQEEIDEADPEWEEVKGDERFAATRADRDVEFLNKLCSMLEEKGLSAIATPAPQKPKKAHVPKEFKPGDVIRKNTIRDVPLPAHIRIPIDKRNVDKDGNFVGDWYEDYIEKVVTKLGNGNGYMNSAYVVDGKAGAPNNFDRKSNMEGAIFLGKWTGGFSKFDIRPKFFYTKRGIHTSKKNS